MLLSPLNPACALFQTFSTMIIKTDALIDSLKCLLIYTIACLPGASSKIHNLQLTPELSACYTRFHNVTLNRVVGKFLMWHCESSLTNSISLLRLSYPQRRYFYNLAQRLNGVGYRRGKRQARRCVRREYRVLNRQEREDFHRAVNGLKGNRVSWRNAYRKEGNVLFNDALNTFYLRLYDI